MSATWENVHVCPTTTQINMRIRAVWSESSFSAWRNIASLGNPNYIQWRFQSDCANAFLKWVHTSLNLVTPTVANLDVSQKLKTEWQILSHLDLYYLHIFLFLYAVLKGSGHHGSIQIWLGHICHYIPNERSDKNTHHLVTFWTHLY